MLSYMNQGSQFYQNVFRLSLPMIIQNLLGASLGMLDTFMVGTLGEAPMAAVTLANIPVNVVMLMTFGLQSGSTVLISQYYGKGDEDSINQVLGIGLLLGGGLELLFGCVMFFFPTQFMSLFGNDPQVIALAAQYARIVAFSFFCDTLASVYVAMNRAIERPILGTWLFTASGVVNAFLNWVFIFGNLGAPRMGVRGAALATTIARVLELVIALVHALNNKHIKLRLSRIFRPSGEMIRRFIKYGTPVLLNETLWGLGTSVYSTILGHMKGSAAILAAYAISGNIERLCTVAVFAISGAAGIIIGREIGAGRKDRVYDIGRCLNMLSIFLGLVIGIPCIGLTLWVFRPYLYPLFSMSAATELICTQMCVITFAIMPLRAFNTTNVVGVLRAGGDVKMASVIDLAPIWLGSIPLTFFLGIVLQMDILWVALAYQVESFIKFFIGMMRLHSGKWIRDLTAG